MIDAFTAAFVGCRLDSGEHHQQMRGYGLGWLPGQAVVLPAKERLVHSWIGFLPPEHYRAELAFARGQGAYAGRDLAGALEIWRQLVTDFPASERAPEALYWCGVAAYRREKGGMDAALPEWRRVVDEYPQSLWARKVEIFCEDDAPAGA